MSETILPALILLIGLFAIAVTSGVKKPQEPPKIDRGKDWPVSPPPPRVKR